MRTPNVPSPTYQLGGWKYILETLNPSPPPKKKAEYSLQEQKSFTPKLNKKGIYCLFRLPESF